MSVIALRSHATNDGLIKRNHYKSSCVIYPPVKTVDTHRDGKDY